MRKNYLYYILVAVAASFGIMGCDDTSTNSSARLTAAPLNYGNADQMKLSELEIQKKAQDAELDQKEAEMKQEQIKEQQKTEMIAMGIVAGGTLISSAINVVAASKGTNIESNSPNTTLAMLARNQKDGTCVIDIQCLTDTLGKVYPSLTVSDN